MRRRLFVLLVAALALAGACAPDGNPPAATDATVDEAPAPESVTAVPTSGPTATQPAGGGAPPTVPPSPACEVAARVVQDDAALGLARGAAGDDVVEALEASLAGGLDQLSSSGTTLATPAGELADAVAPGVSDDAPDTTEAFAGALFAECALRLSGLGALRPGDGEAASLAGLGLARLDGDTCESADALRWADARWRAAPDGGERDRLGVIVRHALGALRLGDADDGDVELDLPADIERADLSGDALSPDHRIAAVRLDADLRRACDAGLELGGLLMERSAPPSAAALDALTAPDWAQPEPVDADTSHSRWCAITDDIYAHDVALAASEAFALDGSERLGLDLRLLLGALRAASRSGGSVATLADVRDVVAAASIIERADLSGSGLLADEEQRAVAELDRVAVANCGAGLSSEFGLLGPYVGTGGVADPAAPPTAAPATTGAPETSTTSTSLPARLPRAEVAVVGDSLTLSAKTEITDTLEGLGLDVVAVDGQVSRRMTSSTDTIRSGRTVVERIAASTPPAIWVIALGTNDVASGSSRDAIRTSVERVLAAIPSDALVVWVDTWIRNERDAVVAGNRIISDVVSARPGAVVADFFSFGDDPGVVGGDGVHLTTDGRRLFANVIANGIADVLGRNPVFDLTPRAPTAAAPASAAPTVVPPAATTTTTAPPVTAATTTSTTSTTTSTTSPAATTTTQPSITTTTVG